MLAQRVESCPRQRFLIGLCALLAVLVGITLAAGQLAPAILLTLSAAGLALAWSRWIRIETAIIGFVFAGYAIGNRGFAQIQLHPQLPLLFAEAALATAGALILLRGAFAREFPLRRDLLNAALLALLAVGAARMPFDLKAHGFWAVRDFATVYYLGFFFIVQAIAGDPRERHRLGLLIVATGLALPPVVAVFMQFEPFFVERVTFRGTPIIFMKEDLAATFLLALIFPLLACDGPARSLRWAAAAAALLVGLALLSRAALVGFGLAGLLALRGGDRRWLTLAAWALPAGLVAAVGLALVQDIPWRESRPYALYEHVISITDLDGTRGYVGAASLDSGDNNRFRLAWWETIARRVVAENPVFGLGFGADLARDFVAAYSGVGDDFNVRSPHSIVFTGLGRLGLVGLLLGAVVVVALLRSVCTAARAARAGVAGGGVALAWWCAAAVVLTSACFGVVLENPMGAVFGWTLVGLAQGSTVALDGTGAENSVAQRDPSLHPTPETVIRPGLS